MPATLVTEYGMPFVRQTPKVLPVIRLGVKGVLRVIARLLVPLNPQALLDTTDSIADAVNAEV